MKAPSPRKISSGWLHHASTRMVWPNARGGMVVCACAIKLLLSGRRLDSRAGFSFQGNPEAGFFYRRRSPRVPNFILSFPIKIARNNLLLRIRKDAPAMAPPSIIAPSLFGQQIGCHFDFPLASTAANPNTESYSHDHLSN